MYSAYFSFVLGQVESSDFFAAHHVLKTKAVCETPSHKQKRNSVWRRQEKERRRTQTVPEITVVQESPNKPGMVIITLF